MLTCDTGLFLSGGCVDDVVKNWTNDQFTSAIAVM